MQLNYFWESYWKLCADKRNCFQMYTSWPMHTERDTVQDLHICIFKYVESWETLKNEFVPIKQIYKALSQAWPEITTGTYRVNMLSCGQFSISIKSRVFLYGMALLSQFLISENYKMSLSSPDADGTMSLRQKSLHKRRVTKEHNSNFRAGYIFIVFLLLNWWFKI